jgi:hypothetical protein
VYDIVLDTSKQITMTETESNTQRKKLIVITIVALLVVIALAVLRNQSTAKIAVAPTGYQSLVFTNKSERAATQSDATTTYSVGSGDTEVIVSSNERYPWRETISVEAGSTTVIRPFLVPEQPRVIRDAPDTVKEQLTRQRVDPTKSATSSDENVRIIANENDKLIAEWIGPRNQMPDYYSCQNEEGRCGVEVYAQNNETIEQVGFYPERSDVAVFATENAVYAIEIDPTGKTQNFQPINTTLSNPRFLVTEEAIFVGNDQQITASQI